MRSSGAGRVRKGAKIRYEGIAIQSVSLRTVSLPRSYSYCKCSARLQSGCQKGKRSGANSARSCDQKCLAASK